MCLQLSLKSVSLGGKGEWLCLGTNFFLLFSTYKSVRAVYLVQILSVLNDSLSFYYQKLVKIVCPGERSPAVETIGLHLNPGPTDYLLCDHKPVTSLLRVSLASLASEDSNTTLRVVLGTGTDILEVPVKPLVNSGIDCSLPVQYSRIGAVGWELGRKELQFPTQSLSALP